MLPKGFKISRNACVPFTEWTWKVIEQRWWCWPPMEFNIISFDFPWVAALTASPPEQLVGVEQPHREKKRSQTSRGPSPPVAMVKHHRKAMQVCVRWPHYAAGSCALGVRCVGVGLLKRENPAAWKTQRSAILASTVMRHNVRGVGVERRPQRWGPAVL